MIQKKEMNCDSVSNTDKNVMFHIIFEIKSGFR